jgi:hypothetical protein
MLTIIIIILIEILNINERFELKKIRIFFENVLFIKSTLLLKQNVATRFKLIIKINKIDFRRFYIIKTFEKYKRK